MIKFWIGTTIAALVTAYYGIEYRLWSTIIEADATFMSAAMITLFVLTIPVSGYMIKKGKIDSMIQYGQVLVDKYTQLGMLGTMIGFIIMLSAFSGVDFANTDQVQKLMTSFSSGMGTALYTTAVGLILSGVTDIYILIIQKLR